jgi:ribose transport system substrate-binding protein
MRIVLSVLVLVGAVLSASCDRHKNDAGQSSPGSSNGKLRIAVIPKGSTHSHWIGVHEGANKAGAELGVEILWKSPLKENDRAQQIEIVQQFVGDKVDGIVLAPLDDRALLPGVQEASAARIPVVIIDSSIKGEVGKDYVSYVATDNYHGGELAGEQMVTALGDKGKVIMLRYMVGSASTDQRESGFLDVIKKHPGITVISDNRYGGATASESQKEAMNMLDQLKNADGVYCPNESSTWGMLLALRDGGLAGKIKFVGFDITLGLVKALAADEIVALIIQDPHKMGYEGVKAVVAAARHQPVEPHIDTGVRVITKGDLGSPEMKQLLEQK